MGMNEQQEIPDLLEKGSILYVQSMDSVQGPEAAYYYISHYELRGKVTKRFGHPFLLDIKEGEKAKDTLQRIGTWLGVSREDCGSWSLSILQGGVSPKVVEEVPGESHVMNAVPEALSGSVCDGKESKGRQWFL